MEKSSKRELQNILFDLKELEDKLGNVISAGEQIDGKSNFWQKNPRATELGSLLLRVHETKVSIISKLSVM